MFELHSQDRLSRSGTCAREVPVAHRSDEAADRSNLSAAASQCGHLSAQIKILGLDSNAQRLD